MGWMPLKIRFDSHRRARTIEGRRRSGGPAPARRARGSGSRSRAARAHSPAVAAPWPRGSTVGCAAGSGSTSAEVRPPANMSIALIRIARRNPSREDVLDRAPDRRSLGARQRASPRRRRRVAATSQTATTLAACPVERRPGEPVVEPGGEVGRDDGAEHGDREQARDPRDGVVDARMRSRRCARRPSSGRSSVSGATVAERPSPKTISAGRTSVGSAGSRRPGAAAGARRPPTIGPALIGSRGPTRAVNAPKRGERKNSISEIGSPRTPRRAAE